MSNITIKTKDFKDILAKLRIITKKGIGYDSFLFAFQDKFLTYNRVATVIYQYNLFDLDDEFAIDFMTLDKFIKNAKGEEVVITTNSETVTFRVGREEIETAKNEKVFKEIKAINFNIPRGYEDLPSDFVEGLNVAKEFVSADVARPVLNFVRVDNDVIEATNGQVLCRYTMDDSLSSFFIKNTDIANIVTIEPDMYYVEEGKLYLKNKILGCHFILANSTVNPIDFDHVINPLKDVERYTFGEDALDKLEIASVALNNPKVDAVVMELKEGNATISSENGRVKTKAVVTVDTEDEFIVKCRSAYLRKAFECSNKVAILPSEHKMFADNGRYCVVVMLMKTKE